MGKDKRPEFLVERRIRETLDALDKGPQTEQSKMHIAALEYLRDWDWETILKQWMNPAVRSESPRFTAYGDYQMAALLTGASDPTAMIAQEDRQFIAKKWALEP